MGEFSRRFKMLVKTCVPELWLRGEISNLKTYSSGHTYFTLKDEEGSISAVLFKGYSRAVSFQLREGMKVFLYGEIAVYEVRGCYQMVVKAALPDGTGDLARRFEELKKRLSAEGLFDSERKKPIPRLPGKIAVVTSPTGAAIRDFCKILKRRGWRGKVYILPAKVQGIGSAAEIAERVKADYPEVELSYMYVDNCAMQLVRNPRQFDTIVTSNMFGDILSDEASMISGSIGMLASASLAKGTFGLYEPIHGSAPDIAGQQKANPLATILSGAMMLRYTFGESEAADAIEQAVDTALTQARTPDIYEDGFKKITTSEMGDLVASLL